MRRHASLLLFASLAIGLPLACSEDAADDDGANGGTSAAGTAGSATAGKSGAAGSAGSAAGAIGAGGAGGAASAGSAGKASGAGAGGNAGNAGAGVSGAGNGGGGNGGANAAGAGGSAGAGSGGTGGNAGVAGVGGALAGSAGTGGASGGTAGNSGAGGAGGGSAFAPCPTNGDPCRVLPFGDSITDGFNVPGGYRMELFSLANGGDHAMTFVGADENGPDQVDGVPFPRNHEGHSGWKIAELLDRIPDPAFDVMPHIVLLMIGTNDVLQNDNLSQAPTRLGNLIDQIVMTAPDALVVVAKLTPLNGTNNTRVMTYNDAIPAVVTARANAGKHVVLIDQFTNFPMNELADGIHPNQAGYDRMGGVWYAAIENLLP